MNIFDAFTAVSTTIEVMPALLGWFSSWQAKRRQEEVVAQLERIGANDPERIERLVDQWADAQEAPVSKDLRQEIRITLQKLVRNAHFVSDQGTPKSIFLRAPSSLNMLLQDVQPRRRKGEPVAPNVTNWELTEFLGMGSFGEVWRAQNTCGDFGSRAYKFYNPGENRSSINSIHRELANLKEVYCRIGAHNHIVPVCDVNLDASMPFIAFEHIDGGTLEEWLYEHPNDRQALEIDHIIHQLVQGMTAAHRRGIAHRDLKPANILLTLGKSAQVKITDFGLARANALGDSSLRSSQVDLAVGTGLYMPPEAMATTKNIDAQKQDVFAIGCIWYQLLVQSQVRPPYDFARRLASLGVDAFTIDLITLCLASTESRFASAEILAQAMEERWPTIKMPTHDSAGEPLYDVQQLVQEYDHHVRQAGRLSEPSAIV